MKSPHVFSTPATAQLPGTPTHCVFRRRSSWLAFPAVAIREVMPRPALVPVPRTPSMFVGLCHVRSEFMPVLNLDPLLSDRHRVGNNCMLIIDDPDGCWGVLIDEVAGLAALEISDAPETDRQDAPSAVIGWAKHGDTLVQVLEPTRIRELATHELTELWDATHASRITT